jgi:hypothetical protein
MTSFLKKAFPTSIKTNVTIEIHSILLDGEESSSIHYNYSDKLRVIFDRGDNIVKKTVSSEYQRIKLTQNGDGSVEFEEKLSHKITFYKSGDDSLQEKKSYLIIERQIEPLSSASKPEIELIGKVLLNLSVLLTQRTTESISLPILGIKSKTPLGKINFNLLSTYPEVPEDEIESEMGTDDDLPQSLSPKSNKSKTPRKGFVENFTRNIIPDTSNDDSILQNKYNQAVNDLETSQLDLAESKKLVATLTEEKELLKQQCASLRAQLDVERTRPLYIWEPDSSHSTCMNDKCKVVFSVLKRR